MIHGEGVTLAWHELAAAVLVALALGAALGRLLAPVRTETDEGTIDVEDLPDDLDPETYVQLGQPDIADSRFGLAGTLWALYKHHIRRRRLARKGYVQWFLIENGTLTGPHYVHPERSAQSKEPKVEYGDGEYFFPEKAMVPDQRSRMYTVIHREGDAAPINLREGDEPAIPAEAVAEWADMQVTASKPGLLSDLDLDPKTIMYIAIGGTLLIAVIGGQF